MAPLGGGGLRAALARAFPAQLWAGHRRAAGGACAPSAPDELRGEPDRFGAVWVRLGAQAGLDAEAFERGLRAAVRRWRAQGRTAVWLHVPIAQSGCIVPAAALGFRFHHAEAAASLLSLWLRDEPCRLPGFATHQVGVAGAVFDENTKKILVVQDRDKVKSMWKFPGGLSEPGENIGDTAVREVFEETGVRAEFRSLLSLRQQHHSPGAFGKSDLFVVCRLEPRSRAIRLCTHECARGAWMDLGRLARTARTTALTSRVARLLLYGHQAGFDKVDLPMEQLPAVHPGLSYQLYHRALPASYRAAPGDPRTLDTARPEGAAPRQDGGARGRGSDFGRV